jgi:hypothetical protein
MKVLFPAGVSVNIRQILEAFYAVRMRAIAVAALAVGGLGYY